MAYQKGTASNYKDVLAKLRTFALAQGWTAKTWIHPADGEHELVLFSAGDSGTDSIHVGYKTHTDMGAQVYNIKVWTGVTYVGGTVFENVAGASPIKSLGAWEQAMPYHFVVTKQTIIVILNVSTTYHYSYNGNIRPYTSRGHWPSPICSMASCANPALRWSDNSGATSGIQRPRSGNYIKVRNDAGNWVDVKTMYPITSGGPIYSLGDYPSGNKIIQKYIYFDVECYGEPDNLYYVQGSNISAGQILDESGVKFLVVPDVFRSGLNDYFCVRLA